MIAMQLLCFKAFEYRLYWYTHLWQVRPMCPETSINPMLLKSASRGSHAARKHLLMATVPKLTQVTAAQMLSSIVDERQGLSDDQSSPRNQNPSMTSTTRTAGRLHSLMKKLRSCDLLTVSYLSIGPESGFGGTNK
jgi:hypothetical protein